ncbi:ubiquitin-associated and sh3 domain-containing protein b [Plakobranchus ocellatus]|uniref:Ubiquitin-associated and sh3 domain-containing protein b n=1 Tax=Plakobranchus ocellatus TaxID=259542 RepID=A0AAV4B916_9GAST|nr:ubiquitin-associated and sh3 domain-containing protein b [Plakobranchus ocellatus]
MAALPPRRKSQQSLSSWADKSPLEILQLMGFPQQRVEKAIAATGNRGVQHASEWLLNHVNDPNLDRIVPREYIIYLCPKGKLLEQLHHFWEESLRRSGWNAAHIYYPHITLCSFFSMPDNKVGILDPLMELLLLEMSQWPHLGPIKLDLYTKNRNFIGFFVTSPHDAYIESLMVRLEQEFLKAGVEMKPQLKQLHLTLAFQYSSDQHDTLMTLAQKIDLSAAAHWEIQVFSRDAELKTAEVRRVLKHYKPQQADELELNTEDFVYMNPEEHDTSPDGWYKGTSWKTGVSAFFPGNFTTKCAQMEMWTLHRYATLFNFSTPQLKVNHSSGDQEGKQENSFQDMKEAGSGDYDNVWNATDSVVGLYSSVNKLTPNVKPPEVPRRPPRKLLVVRHGERCDFAFYRTWFEKSFDADGHYKPINLNCPKFLVRRSSVKDFDKDSPLTLIGRHQARLTGEALLDAGRAVTAVYCSPSLRCVETASEILKGMRSPCRLKMEPCLFEWAGWCKPKLPPFMSPAELEANGFPVDSEYKSFLKVAEISITESIADYYNRSFNFTKSILKRHKAEGGILLFVGHSGTLDASTRQILGQQPREPTSFRDTIKNCPYCAMCCMEEKSDHEGAVGGGWRLRERSGEDASWRLVEPPVLPLTHSANKDFSWETLLS